MRSRRLAEAFTVKSSGGSQQRSTWQSAEIISYRIARERSSAALARQAPRGTSRRIRLRKVRRRRPRESGRRRAVRGARLVPLGNLDLAADLAARRYLRVD